jgi:hypothetical protein
MRSVLCIIASLIVLSSSAQNADSRDLEMQNIIEQRIEIISSSQSEGSTVDYTNLVEDLTYFFENPLDVNTATTEELQSLYMLSDLQINALQNHLLRYGKMTSIFELQAVPGFDLQTIRLIQPFIGLKPIDVLQTVTAKQVFKESSSELFLRYRRTLQTMAGFKPNPETGAPPQFLGSKDYYYTRYKFQFRKNIIAGFTLEKDAGEPLNNGPDFRSAHLYYRGTSWLKALVIGDYQAQFGQGLTFWNGLGFGKSPFVLNVKKSAVGLRPYRSVNEALYLRGTAITVQKKAWEVTLFGSRKKLDANVQENTDSLSRDDEFIASSIIISGLHRTASEIAKMNAISETILGGHVTFDKRWLTIGFTGAHRRLDKSLISSNTSLYQLYDFKGKTQTNLGIDYQSVIRNFNIFGEVSRSANGGIGMLHGLLASLSPRVSFSAVYRNFQPQYQPMYFNVFAENFTPQNERGLFMGLQANLGKVWTLSAYSDQIKYPWLRFRVQAPSNASDYLIQLNFKPDRKNELYLRYQVRDGAQNGNIADAFIDYPVARRQQTWRFNATYTPHENVQMRTRAQWQSFQLQGSQKEQGFLMYQDVIWEKLGSPLSVTLRYALFNTDTWNTRIYAFETDVLYGYSIPPYYGKGQRAYAVVKYNIKRGLDVWLRVAQWTYTDRKTISSGLNEIAGNERTDCTIQIRWQF